MIFTQLVVLPPKSEGNWRLAGAVTTLYIFALDKFGDTIGYKHMEGDVSGTFVLPTLPQLCVEQEAAGAIDLGFNLQLNKGGTLFRFRRYLGSVHPVLL